MKYTYEVPTDKDEFKRQMREGDAKLRKVIIDGVNANDAMCCFFSSIQKTPKVIGGGRGCVVATERGIKFFFDPFHVIKMSAEEIRFMLAHELGHIVNRHFTRAETMCHDLAIEKADFYAKYAPYADLPVNESLRAMLADMSDCLTYETAKIDKDANQTFEQIVRYLIKHPDENMFHGDGGGNVWIVGEDGEITPGNTGNGTCGDINVINVPETSQDPQGTEDMIKRTLRRVAENLKGRGTGAFAGEIQKYLDADVDTGSVWRTIERTIQRFGTKMRARTYNAMRLSRKTQLPPGRSRQRGFSMKVILDVSGSMGDVEVAYMLELIKEAGLSSLRDTIHFIQWTTNPCEEVDTLNNAKMKWPEYTLKRKNSGGTDFTNIWSHPLSAAIKDDVNIVLTDGICGFPSEPSGKPEMWIITTQNGYNAWEREYGHGLGILIPENAIAELVESKAS